MTEELEIYKNQETEFLAKCYKERVFPAAKDQQKLLCHECFTGGKEINFFETSGIKHHFRLAYNGKKFLPNKSAKLFEELHADETEKLVGKLSTFRREFGVGLDVFKEFRVNSPSLSTEVATRNKKEAAKLCGLILFHKNVVRGLQEDGYVLGVFEEDNVNDFAEKFRVWKASAKIYTESFYMKEVS